MTTNSPRNKVDKVRTSRLTSTGKYNVCQIRDIKDEKRAESETRIIVISYQIHGGELDDKVSRVRHFPREGT